MHDVGALLLVASPCYLIRPDMHRHELVEQGAGDGAARCPDGSPVLNGWLINQVSIHLLH